MKYSDAVTRPLGLVLFFSVIFALSPSHVVNGWLQGSLDPDAGTEVFVGSVAGNALMAPVGDAKLKGATVFVGNGVAVEASVGGSGVAVGMAACVSATMVNAAAMAVP